MSRFTGGIAAVVTLWTSVAAAQAPAPTPAPAAPPAAAPTPAAPTPAPAPTAAPTPAPAAPGGCVPACRDGFLCHQGMCISACNPPCAAGTVCSGEGQCVAADATGAAPAPAGEPPPPMYPGEPPPPPVEPPPPDEPATPAERKVAPEEYTFRPYFGMHLGLGGRLTVSDGYYYDYETDEYYDGYEVSSSLNARPGFMGGMEFRFGKIFGVGPAFRVTPAVTDNLSLVDIMVAPTFHIPFKMVEVTIPIYIGGTLANRDGPFSDEDGGGFTFGITPGVGIYFLPFMGVYANFGFTTYVMGFDSTVGDADSYLVTIVRPVMDTGLTFAF